jgi:hypothetical protein
MFQELTTYLGHHPVVLSSIGVFVLLAVVGAWYVLSHHLHALLITLLCAAGFAAGVLVFYRGYQSNMRDLMAVGAFLTVCFPVIYQQAIRVAKVAYGGAPSATAKGHAERAQNRFSVKRPSST